MLTSACRCCVICGINNSLSEMVTYMPVVSPFVRFAGRFVDESFGVATGWNFFVFVGWRHGVGGDGLIFC